MRRFFLQPASKYCSLSLSLDRLNLFVFREPLPFCLDFGVMILIRRVLA